MPHSASDASEPERAWCSPGSRPLRTHRVGERRSLLEAAVQALPVGVILRNSEGQCILANAAAHRLGGARALDDPGAGEYAQDIPREVEEQVREFRSEDEDYSLTTLTDIGRHLGIQRELLQRAYIDSLTGLPNRSLVEQSVEDLIAGAGSGDTFALAFIDVDNFKHINDYYSHAVGDALLSKMAGRIGAALGPNDMLARVGGDEFVLLLAPAPDPAATRALVVAMAEALKQPFFIDDHEIFASASVGISLFPAHGGSYDVLRRKADSAMYRVKGGVKGGVSMFEATMGRAATARMAVEQRLRLAIRDRCFRCAYQPKVDLRTGEVYGVEVLLRWRDEAGAIHPPGDFIELAVELGLLNEITRGVLAESVKALPDIDELFGPAVTVSINIAAKQASDLPFMISFIDSLAATGHASRFVIEITEEAFFAKNHFQAAVLPRIRQAGARVSIDDFGVGYSSLAALAEITADELKIDRSFITDIHKRPRSQIVLRAIESLACALGMTVVAEGVETEEEIVYLQASTGIRCGQGYYFARPMLIEQIRGEDARPVAPRLASNYRRAPPVRRRLA